MLIQGIQGPKLIATESQIADLASDLAYATNPCSY